MPPSLTLNAGDYRRHMERAARNRPAKSGWLLVLLVAGAALVVAVFTAWAMAPRSSIEPVGVDPAQWFSAGMLDRAEAFRSGQRWLYVAQIGVQFTFLLALSAGPLAGRVSAMIERPRTHPALVGLVVSAMILSALQLIALPFSLVGHERSVDVGLSTQDLGAWSLDWLLASSIFVVVGSLLLSGALWLGRRLADRWWIAGSVAVVAFAVLVTWAAPALITPLFNDYDPLEPGPARDEVTELAEAAGVDIGGVYRVDASKRTTGLNAFVDGIGSTKRVVLYDTLIDGLPADQRRSVIAHELAHAERSDLWRGLLWVAAVTPLAVLFVSVFSVRIQPGGSRSRGLPVSLPALVLAIGIALTAIQTVGNGLSRAVEWEADLRALELTDEPRALIGLQRRLAQSNLSQPDPPGWSQFLFGTHPTADERIGLGLAWERGERRK